MNHPSPALVAQSAVRRLPRLALLLFCAAYVLPGFFGRTPWKNADITAFGIMRELGLSSGQWLHPKLMGQTEGVDGLMAYWLGALAIKVLPFLEPALAVRVPFVVLLALTLAATWYGVYYLARSPQAQPVAFAFGGEASPLDYARAIADAGLLALIACLGLAQLSHETTPALSQLAFSALVFYSVAASAHHWKKGMLAPAAGFSIGMAGLALSGAPTIMVLLGLGSIAVEWAHARKGGDQRLSALPASTRGWMILMAGVTAAVSLLSYVLDLWTWRIDVAGLNRLAAPKEWGSLIRLLLWFPWPAWPLALWTLWRWRRQLASRHVALPLWFAAVVVTATVLTSASDRGLLLSLPPLAALAAFALPTLKRSMASLIDWFTLLFFTSCAIVIWVIWVAMQTGVPSQPAANVARLAPGFEPGFSIAPFAAAVLATLAWAWLVKWRTGAQRAALWKSLVLPAGGTTLCWLLLMTLWLPLLDYARSYAPLSRQVASLVDRTACVQVYGLNTAQTAALLYHGGLELHPLKEEQVSCPYLVVDADAQATLSQAANLPDWAFMATIRRPTDNNENVLLFKRVGTDSLGQEPLGEKPSAPEKALSTLPRQAAP